MRTCMLCTPSPPVDEESVQNVQWQMGEDPLLESREVTHGRRSFGSKLCCGCCCGCCCLLLLGVAIVGGFAANCVRQTTSQDSIALPVVKKLGGSGNFTLQNMTKIPESRWSELSAHVHFSWKTENGYPFGYVAADAAPELLLNASKVDGISDQIPEKLRGVYWMQGNLAPQVLGVLNYAKWYDQEQTLLMPNSPWTWAWWGGQDAGYPHGLDMASKLVHTLTSGKDLAESYTADTAINTTLSFVFEKCPAGAVCKEGEGNLTYAKIMMHPNGNLRKHGMVFYDGYTMEQATPAAEVPEGQRDGALFFHRAEIFCGLLGRGTGYNLTKIIDGNGKRVDPYFTEYLRFMDNNPLIVWSGLLETPTTTVAPSTTAETTASATTTKEAGTTAETTSSTTSSPSTTASTTSSATTANR